jgi:phage FluMu protein Com
VLLLLAGIDQAGVMDPLHATIEEFAAEGYTHIECFCPRCRVIRLRPMSWLPKISMGLTLDALSRRLRCAECGGPLQSVKPGGKPTRSGSRRGVEGEVRQAYHRHQGHEREVLMAMPDGRLAYVAPGSQWVRIAPLRFAQLI